MNRRLLVIIFVLLGLGVAVASANYLTTQLEIFATLIGVYIIIMLPLYAYLRNKKEKELRKIIIETLFNYLLTWIVIFFLLSNI